MPSAIAKLRAIKVMHTVAWAFFASAILVVPVAAWLESWTTAFYAIAIVTVECLILFFNRMRCPLTDVAARYTENRADNFDIYLPRWLARHNKLILGTLFLVSVLFVLVRRFAAQA